MTLRRVDHGLACGMAQAAAEETGHGFSLPQGTSEDAAQAGPKDALGCPVFFKLMTLPVLDVLSQKLSPLDILP